MERLTCEKQDRAEGEEEAEGLREEVADLRSQLLRHQEEVEELTALYESEKSQNCALEDAVRAEKANFNKVVSPAGPEHSWPQVVASLESERQRSKTASAKDSDTIMELRTALEVRGVQESRSDSVCRLRRSKVADWPWTPSPLTQGGGREAASCLSTAAGGSKEETGIVFPRNSLPGHKSPALRPEMTEDSEAGLVGELVEERGR